MTSQPTQPEFSTFVGTGAAQARIARLRSRRGRIEIRPDMLLSTLASYLAAAGERPRVVVTIAGHDIEVDLTSRIRR